MSNLLILPPPIVVSPPSGASKIPIVEVDKSKLPNGRKQIRLRKGSRARVRSETSFGSVSQELDFTAWEFFHAAKKTELTRTFTPQEAERRASAFALEHEGTFYWDPSNFRLADGASSAFEDFAASSLAGRVGEAIAYLAMVKWGYVYWDRCATVWARATRNASIEHADRIKGEYLSGRLGFLSPQNQPDFVFENASREVALMEAKGGFVNATRDDPSAKTDLRKALQQLEAWASIMIPRPKKTFGIGTYLRERGDTTGDPSLVTFFDPEVDEQRAGDPKSDLIRRCNYGAWLWGMGLTSAGEALRELREKDREKLLLPVLRLGTLEIAFIVMGLQTDRPLMHFGRHAWWEFDFPPMRDHEGVLVMGLEVRTLILLGYALRRLQDPVLLDVDRTVPDSTDYAERREPKWSLMPDGSFVGIVGRDRFFEAMRDVRPFEL